MDFDALKERFLADTNEPRTESALQMAAVAAASQRNLLYARAPHQTRGGSGDFLCEEFGRSGRRIGRWLPDRGAWSRGTCATSGGRRGGCNG